MSLVHLLHAHALPLPPDDNLVYTGESYIEDALALKREELLLSRSKQTFKQRKQIVQFFSPYLAMTALSGLLSYGLANLSKELILKLTAVVTLPVRTVTSFFNYFTLGTAYETELNLTNPFSEDIVRYTHLGMTCIFVVSFLLLYGLHQLTCIQEISFLGFKLKRRNDTGSSRRHKRYPLRKTQKLKRRTPSTGLQNENENQNENEIQKLT